MMTQLRFYAPLIDMYKMVRLACMELIFSVVKIPLEYVGVSNASVESELARMYLGSLPHETEAPCGLESAKNDWIWPCSPKSKTIL